MRKLLFIFFALFFSQAFGQESSFEKGEILIQLRANTDHLAFIRIVEENHSFEIQSFDCLSKIANIYKVEFVNEDENLDKTIASFYENSSVIHAQKNHFIFSRETIPTDTLFDQQWFHKNTAQFGGTIDADIDTPDAWDITTGGVTTHEDTIVVCIIEASGVDISHLDLADNIWHNYAEIENNGIDDDNNGYVDDFNGWNVSSLDDQVGSGSHGTEVAGMIGAKGNNVTGVSGVNWDVKMMIVKGQNAGNESSVIAAYDYPLVMRKKYNDSFGQEGAFVVVTNASWGIDNGNPANVPLWCAMYDTLGTYGILNIAATTNNNIDVDVNGDLPTACSSQYLIGVTMTNDTDVRAASGYGPTHVDLAAPGAGVLLTNAGNIYSSVSGTSFASPCVAGAVALAYSAPCPEFIALSKTDPAAAALDMRNYILTSVDVIPALAGEVGSGGRLNVKSTIDSLLANCTITACNAPYHLHASDITDTTAKFYWDGFSTDYLVYIQASGGSTIEIPVVNQDSLLIDTLTPCTSYTIWTKSICGVDTSAFSPAFSFTTDGCCNNPMIDMDYSSVDTITVSWNPVLYATAYDVRHRKDGDVTWIETILDTISPLTLSGLDTCTAYEFQIKTICTDSTHGFSPSYIHSTKGCGACLEIPYCDVIGANPNSEWIDSISVNWASNASGQNGGWYQSTAVLCGFEAGLTYPVVLKPGYSGTFFTEHFTIWVDQDHNGIFDATDIVLNNQTTNSVLTANITIPITAGDGITKMRIGMNGTTTPEACPNGSFWGEYEDYCVYIGADAGIEEEENVISIYPNPTLNLLYITSSVALQEMLLYSQDGKLIQSLVGNTEQIDVSHLQSGIYILHLQTENGLSIHKFVKQ